MRYLGDIHGLKVFAIDKKEHFESHAGNEDLVVLNRLSFQKLLGDITWFVSEEDYHAICEKMLDRRRNGQV